MKALLLKFGLWGLIAALIGAHELFLPKDQYTFRVWEAIALRGQPKSVRLPPGPFYPNQHFERREVGDIAAYSENQVIKEVVWDIDAHGFRHRSGHCQQFPIVVAGDSFGIGTSLTQKDILAEQVAARTGQCVYNLSGVLFPEAFVIMNQLGLRPKTVILVNNERGFFRLTPIPESFKGALPPAVSVGFWTPLWILADRMAKPTFPQYRARHGMMSAMRRFFVPVAHDLKNGSDPKMRFYFGANRPFKMDAAETDRIAGVMTGYREVLKARGTDFIVVPTADKETIYPELIPKAPESKVDLERLYDRLASTPVKYVDLYHPYRDAYRRNETIYYQLDDTHWNAAGVGVAADLIVKAMEPSLRTQ